MSQHIQCGMLKTSAAVRPLHNPTTLIKQIQNLQTIHVKSRTIEMSFNMEMRCVTFYLFTKPLVIISQRSFSALSASLFKESTHNYLECHSIRDATIVFHFLPQSECLIKQTCDWIQRKHFQRMEAESESENGGLRVRGLEEKRENWEWKERQKTLTLLAVTFCYVYVLWQLASLTW